MTLSVFGLIMAGRNIPPSYNILVQNEDQTKEKLRLVLMEGTDYDMSNVDASSIRAKISKIKASVSSYSAASKALSEWYLANGSIEQCNEVRSERLTLAHKEAPECVKSLNQVLRSIDEDLESDLLSLSMSTADPNKFIPPRKEQGENNLIDINGSPQNIPRIGQNSNEISPLATSNFPPRELPIFPPVNSNALVSDVGDIIPTRNFNRANVENNSYQNNLPIAQNLSSEPERLDPLSRRLLKQDLRKGLSERYDGNPSKFWAWYTEINGYIIESEASPTEIIYILKANTAKKPKELIETYLSAGLINPSRILEKIWDEFKKRYGSNSVVTSHLLSQLRSFPKIKHPSQTDDLEKLLSLCRAIQLNMSSCPDLRYLELQQGMREVWEKTPDIFVNRWRVESTSLERRNHSPTLQNLLDAISNFADENSNPNFQCNLPKSKTFATSVLEKSTEDEKIPCPFHDSSSHSIAECRMFKKLPYEERKKKLFENRLCYRCCGPHISTRCNSKVSCSSCGKNHVDSMHPDSSNPDTESNRSNNSHRRISNSTSSNNREKNSDNRSFCSTVCESHTRKNCSKTVPVELRVAGSSNSIFGLCILDEQSNRTFIDDNALRQLNPPSELVKKNDYTLTTLSPNNLSSSIEGVIADGLEVRGIKKSSWIKLPPTLSHPALPDTRNETSSPRIVRAHKHISKFANHFPEIDPNLEVVMLIGTNCGEAMKTRCYGKTYPYVHDTPLGWALVGPSCLDESSSPKVLRTSVKPECQHFQACPNFPAPAANLLPASSDTFVEKPDDELPGLSSNDREFNRIVSDGVRKNENNDIEIPIPVKADVKLPENKSAVYHRSKNTLERLKRDEDKLSKCIEIMQKYIDRGHVEEVDPSTKPGPQVCYIPVFPIVNSKKGKLRLVFDSSARHLGVSLNDCLLQGADEANRLIGILIRFRQKEVGFTADIECMYHSFYVPSDQCDLLRFFWWKENDTTKDLVTYRARVHVFGNRSSPAIATFGLRYTTRDARDSKASQLIHENFYIDDLLCSENNPQEAISALESTRKILADHNIRLHKIVSTHKTVLEAFPDSEIAEDIGNVELDHASSQRTLGISWNVSCDHLQLSVSLPERAFTKRGVLSVNGSLFDPLGLAAPVALKGRLLQRKIFSSHQQKSHSEVIDWDEPLSTEIQKEWNDWLEILRSASMISIPRCYYISAKVLRAACFL